MWIPFKGSKLCSSHVHKKRTTPRLLVAFRQAFADDSLKHAHYFWKVGRLEVSFTRSRENHVYFPSKSRAILVCLHLVFCDLCFSVQQRMLHPSINVELFSWAKTVQQDLVSLCRYLKVEGNLGQKGGLVHAYSSYGFSLILTSQGYPSRIVFPPHPSSPPPQKKKT